MKRFVLHCLVLMLMLCLLTAPLLFAQGRGEVNNADLLGLMMLKEIAKQKAKAKKGMKDIESQSKKSTSSVTDKEKRAPLPKEK